jgi:DNA topoisomerase-1
MECPREGCGGQLLKRVNSKTQEVFYACSNWKDNDCKVTANAQGEIKVAEPAKKHGKCEKCKKGFMVERRSRTGSFLGCNNFPRCRNAKPIEETAK